MAPTSTLAPDAWAPTLEPPILPFHNLPDTFPQFYQPLSSSAIANQPKILIR